MINEKELRIGSIVTVDNPEYHPKLKGLPLRVTGMQERVIKGKSEHCLSLEHINQKPNTYNETYSQYMRFIKPIRLSEEILVEHGATKELHNITLDLQDEKYLPDGRKLRDGRNLLFSDRHTDHYQIFLREDDSIIAICMDETYFHQLQNLYFDLTNKELEIKL